VDSFHHAIKLAKLAKEVAGESLSALEYMDTASMSHVLNHFKLKSPFSDMHEDYGAGYMLIEVAGVNAEHDSKKLMQLLDTSLVVGHASDAVVPATSTQSKSLWKLRESCASALTGAGYICYKYDLSLPLSKFSLAMEATRSRLVEHGFSPSLSHSLLTGKSEMDSAVMNITTTTSKKEEDNDAELVCWGHLGDGNIHLNVITRKVSPKLEACLEPWLFEWVIENGGSISAEHGVGRCKKDYMPKVHGPQVLNLMRKLKNVFDPKGILNPNKMIP